MNDLRKDLAKTSEQATVNARNEGHEVLQWKARWQLKKWNPNSDVNGPPDEVIEGEGNLLTTVGANILWNLLTGGAGTTYSNANAYIGVGDGNGSVPAPAAGDTDLTAPTNKLRKAMDATYPTINTNSVTFRSTYGSSDANFAWREWGVFNASSSGTMLNHKGQDLGTKVSGSSWQFQVTLSLS